MTAPHIGNTGVNGEDAESPAGSGSPASSSATRPGGRRTGARRAAWTTSWRRRAWSGYRGIDTRALTRHLRERGAMRVGLSAVEPDPDALLARVPAAPGMVGADLAHEVSHPGAVRGPGGGAKRRVGRRAGPRHQADDPAAAGRAGHRDARAAGRLDRRPSCSDRRPGRGLPLQRPGRPGGRRRRRSRWSAACWPPGVPLFGICFGNQILGRALGFGHVQAALRPPRAQPAGARPRPAGSGHPPQPRLRRRRAARPADRDGLRPGRGQPRRPQRRRRRGAALPGPAGVQRAVPPRGGGRPARRRLTSSQPVRGPVAADETAVPKRSGHRARAGDRLRADRHRPGLRVRLLRHPGLPGAQGGGAAGQPGQHQPGHDHDRPRVRRRHLRRAADRRSSSSEGHRQGAAGRAAGHPRRADRAEHRHRAVRERRAGAVRRPADRRRRRRRSTAARTGSCSRTSSARSAATCPAPPSAHSWTRWSRPPTRSAAGGHPAVVHHGRRRLRARPRPGPAAPDGRRRPGRQPGRRGADRGERARLEGVRARADARPQRQRGGDLLDREHRPDGRAHRRLGHRRARR